MFFGHCVFILVAAHSTLGILKLDIHGIMNVSPTFSYKYRIKHGLSSKSTTAQAFLGLKRKNYVVYNETIKQGPQIIDTKEPKVIDIIINNDKADTLKVNIAELNNNKNSRATKKHKLHSKARKTVTTAHAEQVYPMPYRPQTYDSDKNEETIKRHKTQKHKQHSVKVTAFPMMISAEYSGIPTFKINKHTELPSLRMTRYNFQSTEDTDQADATTKVNNNRKHKGQNDKIAGTHIHRLVQISDDELKKKLSNKTVTPLIQTEKKTETTAFQFSDEHTESPKTNKKHKNEGKDTEPGMRQDSTEHVADKTKYITGHDITKKVTYVDQPTVYKDMFIKTHLVKDDPKIKIFTKHIYEQSIKVFESLKDKMSNKEMKQLSKQLMRSYEDKFRDFVRETQEQKIKTRLGRQKVILNTVDTSNRILERLVNYLISKMDKRGILRNEGSENVILNEINQKRELENKHICNKMQICRNENSLSKFIVEMLNMILSSDDKKITDVNNAVTEVLKNIDFSHVMDADTKKRFHVGIGHLEEYDVSTLRPVLFILKNIFTFKNHPIKVVGPEDSRINKTMALLEILDTWDKNLPPNEQNILEWNDLRNSFKEWSDGKRNDIVDLVQHFVGHITKVLNNLEGDDAKVFAKNVNIILGY